MCVSKAKGCTEAKPLTRVIRCAKVSLSSCLVSDKVFRCTHTQISRRSCGQRALRQTALHTFGSLSIATGREGGTNLTFQLTLTVVIASQLVGCAKPAALTLFRLRHCGTSAEQPFLRQSRRHKRRVLSLDAVMQLHSICAGSWCL